MSLEEEIAELKAKNAALEELVRAQLELIEELRANIDSRDSRRSHSPPSQDSPRTRSQRKKRTRKLSDKKQGAQLGHDPNMRALADSTRVDLFVDCAPHVCSSCGDDLPHTPFRTRKHQVWEIPPPRPHLTEYLLRDFTCACGAITKVRLPDGVSTSNFGPRLHAVCAALRVDARLSVLKTRDALRELFGVKLSAGAVSNMDRRVSQALEQEHRDLHHAVQNADVVHFDETTWYLKGQRQVLWGAVSQDATFMMLRPRRNKETAIELAGEDFAGAGITDRYCSYHWMENSKRQMCWAHLRRDFVAMGLQAGVMGQSGRLLEEEARQVLKKHRQVRQGKMTRADFEVWARGRRDPIKTLLRQAVAAKLPVKHAGVARETLKYFDCLWTFLEHEGVEPTNNTAERALRHPVITRKLSFGSQSERGMRFIERLMSVRATLRQQQRSLLEFLTKRFAGQDVMLLPS